MNTGKSIKKYGFNVHNEKVARRAFTAAGLLRKAYIDQAKDTTHHYLYKKYGYSFMRGHVKQSVEVERIIDGMRKAANKREERAEKELKQQAWAYLSKYIDHMWD
jgi:hypothetical protein